MTEIRARMRMVGPGGGALLVLVLLVSLALAVAPARAQEGGEHGKAEQAVGEHDGGAHPGMSMLMAWKAFLIQLIGFGLLVFLIVKFVWPGLAAQLSKSSGNIAETYARLDASKVDTDRALADLERMIQALPQEEEARIAKARAEGERLRDEMVREAEGQAQRIVEKAKREIEIARDAAVIEVREAVLGRALEAAEARLRTQVAVKMHHTMVNALVEDLGKAGELIRKGGEA